jgi:hypothetical protein
MVMYKSVILVSYSMEGHNLRYVFHIISSIRASFMRAENLGAQYFITHTTFYA